MTGYLFDGIEPRKTCQVEPMPLPRPGLGVFWRLLHRMPGGVTNVEDQGTGTSILISRRWFDVMGIKSATAGEKPNGQTTGTLFEDAIRDFVNGDADIAMSGRGFHATRGAWVTEFAQFCHLLSTHAPYPGDNSGNIWSDDGSNIYLIKPDVAVSTPPEMRDGRRVLHAVLSAKWTIRTSNSQSVHREGTELISRRRGRVPHLMVITAEPQPTRLAALTSGDGTIDRVYHIALPELLEALRSCGESEEIRRERYFIENLVRAGKLVDVSELPRRLVCQ